MKSYMLCLTTILSIVGILATNIAPALALSDTVQQIRTDLDGFALIPDCCTNSTVHVEGNLITTYNGTMQFSLQTGIFTIGATSYGLEFEPTGKLNIKSETDSCNSESRYDQLGELRLTSNDGTILNGPGVYSWGSSSGCSEDNSSFTYFSGKLNSTLGKSMEFFTGNDSLPVIK